MLSHISYPAALPIVSHKDLIIKTIQEQAVIIIAGDTGSGKSTQLPKMCLAAGRGRQKLIGCTQPRRIAATSVAARVAEELGEPGRQLVGYKIRFNDQTSRLTRLKFMTDGILLAETQQDRKLSRYDTIIIDEAHERSLNIDFLLGYLRRLLLTRADLKIIITSATIDTEKFSRHFNEAPVIKVSGRTYPVEIRYLPPAADDDDEKETSCVTRTVESVIDLRRREPPGDILIFMPTERAIRETVESLEKAFGKLRGREASRWPADILILPLFGRLRTADQNRIFQTRPGYKIVVATNVAETSITVPGIKYVIDTGLARLATYNARSRTTGLPVVAISRASCDQRLGRCGRIAAGICIRLYEEEDYLNRPEFTLPEIRRSNLAEVILRMTALKLGDPAEFPFIDPPTSRAIKDGYALLRELGALDAHRRLTATGRLMARLPLDPRIARLLIEARVCNALREITVIAAALTIPDPRTRPADKESEADKIHAAFKMAGSDFLSYLKIWELWQNTLATVKSQSRLRKFCRGHFLSYQRLREWQDLQEQITAILAQESGFTSNARPATYDEIHQALLSGYLRNIALKKTKFAYQGAQGKEVMIFPGSHQFHKSGKWIMAAELVETSNLYARTVADIKVEWIEAVAGPLCRSSFSGVRWEKKRGQVVADEKVTLFGLVLVPARTINYARLNAAAQKEARRVFIQTALVEGNLHGRYDFLANNLKLVAGLEEMEDRLRQRGVVADDSALYDFYEQRLPADICDQAALNRFLKKPAADRALWMTAADILLEIPAAEKLADFPTELPADDFKLKLSYKFEPGAEDDGVTVILPADLLPHLSPALFEWLVPGLLLEKITLLLKGLPKNLRRSLVPIPETARILLADLKPYQDGLHQALAQAIFKRFGLRIGPEHWPTAALPDHLRFNYHLTDPQGRLLKKGRSLAELGEVSPPRPDNDHNLVDLKKQWERESVSTWDFADLPAKILLQLKNHELCGFAFPALVKENPHVALRLLSSETASRQATRQGLLALYGLHFAKQFKYLKKNCQELTRGSTAAAWKACWGLAAPKQFDDELFTFVLEEIFAVRDGLIPARAFFDRKVEEINKHGLAAQSKAIIDQVLAALQDRRLTLDHIAKFEKMAGAGRRKNAHQQRFADYRDQVEQILPADFMKTFTGQRLAMVHRYLQALRIRVERAHVSLEKDTDKARHLAPHLQRLRILQMPPAPSAEWLRSLAEYREMLEEFKISLFAQELKTAYPVSAKRLEKKWVELQSSY